VLNMYQLLATGLYLDSLYQVKHSDATVADIGHVERYSLPNKYKDCLVRYCLNMDSYLSSLDSIDLSVHVKDSGQLEQPDFRIRSMHYPCDKSR
jgi:hypothetical protein